MTAYYFDPRAPQDAPRWRRNDICPDGTPFYIISGHGPLPPTKKEYGDPLKFEDPHLSVFTAPEPFIGGGSKKGKSGGLSTAAGLEQANSSMIPVKGKKSLKKKKDTDVFSFRNWEGEVIPLDVSPLAYLAAGSSQVVVLLPG